MGGSPRAEHDGSGRNPRSNAPAEILLWFGSGYSRAAAASAQGQGSGGAARGLASVYKGQGAAAAGHARQGGGGGRRPVSWPGTPWPRRRA
jgi:hypothetical protein